jgi:hypothetical protein
VRFTTACGIPRAYKLETTISGKNQFSRKPTVKLIRFDGVCEIELIWATQNIDIQIQKDGFWSVGN